ERRRVDVRGGGDEPGVAVGRRLRHVGRADDAAGAGPVLDHKRLAEPRHLRSQHADDEVGRPTRRRGNDDADGLRWIRLCLDRPTNKRGEGDDEKLHFATTAAWKSGLIGTSMTA